MFCLNFVVESIVKNINLTDLQGETCFIAISDAQKRASSSKAFCVSRIMSNSVTIKLQSKSVLVLQIYQ